MNEAKEQGLSNAEYILVEGEMAFLKKEYRKALGDFKKAKETGQKPFSKRLRPEKSPSETS